MSNSKSIPFKEINKLAIPSIIAGISEPLLSIVDTAIIGNVGFDAVEALAAVGIAGSFISAIVWVLGQTRAAISAIVAQYVGEKKIAAIIGLPAQMIFINVLLSLAIYFSTVFVVDHIFQFYNAEGLVLNYAVDYFKIRALGLPFALFVFTVFGVFTGLQNTFWPMVISVIGAFLNAGLDLVLVYGVEGYLEPMHVAGAAYASIIAQAVMAFMALVLFYKKTPFTLAVKFPFDNEIKRLLKLSLNLFLRAIALHITLYFANSYAASYGTAYIAAQTICFQIWLFFAFFIDGYASVGSIISGKQKGERNFSGLEILVKDLNKYALIVAVILSAICFSGYYFVGEIFTSDPEVLKIFYAVFWLVLISQPVNAVAFVYDGVFKGLAEGVVLRNTVMAATFLGFIPTLLLCDFFDLKLLGIWIAFTVWMLFRSGILAVFFKRNFLPKNH
ncbi:MATE family efflux transporter [Flavicella sediminum]|uniref:MATE family efflux transporter n=1 Tax=Flavicella sediminum TaxID=2585141 RepID=UPI00111D632A|nr:MATE family efflux transporter [Flavicella sediminum]